MKVKQSTKTAKIDTKLYTVIANILNEEQVEIKVCFKIGQGVYLTTDPEQMERLCTGYMIEKDSIRYQVSMGEGVSYHSDYELSGEADQFKKLDIQKK